MVGSPLHIQSRILSPPVRGGCEQGQSATTRESTAWVLGQQEGKSSADWFVRSSPSNFSSPPLVTCGLLGFFEPGWENESFHPTLAAWPEFDWYSTVDSRGPAQSRCPCDSVVSPNNPRPCHAAADLICPDDSLPDESPRPAIIFATVGSTRRQGP